MGGRWLLLVVVLAAGVVGSVASLAGASQQHFEGEASGDLGVAGMSEAQLRTWETQVLGPEHAADHAALRRDVRLDKNVPKGPVGGFRLYEHSAAIAPAVGGQWNGRFDIPVIGINAAMLPTGKVLWYAYPNEPDSAPRHNEAWAALWDPSRGTGPDAFKRVDPPIDPATGLSVNIWCSGTSFLADGRVLVTGGNLSYINTPGATYSGLKHVYTFNPFNETWTQQPDMAHGRWYPGQLLMPDGRTVIINGFDEQGIGARNVDVELFTPSPNLNGIGKITKIGTLTGDYVGDYYPHMFWMPSGRALVAGPYTNDSWYLNNPGPSNAFSITDVSNLNRTRIWGDAVILPSAKAGSTKVLEIGGANTTLDYDNAFASNTTEQFDEANPGAGWIPQSSQNIARAHANTVLLPDGSMVTVGGGVGNDSTRNKLWTANPDQMQVELWDPTPNNGHSARPTRKPRLPLHRDPPPRRTRALRRRRPQRRLRPRHRRTLRTRLPLQRPPPHHHHRPPQLQYNTTFDIQTPNTNITKAVLIAPSAATHAINTNQRYVPLTLTQHSRRHHRHRPL